MPRLVHLRPRRLLYIKSPTKTFADLSAAPVAARSPGAIQNVVQEVLYRQRLQSGIKRIIPMDIYRSLLDVTFLHELTHVIWGAGTADVDMAHG